MKKLNLLLIIAFVLAGTNAFAYEILLKSNYKGGVAYLTYYMGKNMYVEDSAAVGQSGVAIFKKEKQLPGGVYAIVFPGKTKMADVIVDKSQKFTITADSSKLEQMVITGAPENNLFKEYQNFSASLGKQMNNERIAFDESKTKADSSLHEANYRKLNDQLNDYRNGIIKNNPTHVLSALLSAMKDPPMPTKVPVTRQDSIDNFNYYKAHYWDGITFMDERIVRTPFFMPKLERYYREVIYNLPKDSITKDIDYKLLLSRTAPEMRKFLLNWFTDEYINARYMGQDAIFVHLFNKYHSKGETSWLNDKQKETISRRAYMLMGNLVGEGAAELEMIGVDGKPLSLYGVKAEYTLVVFWDPNCGHCREEIPRIDSMYQAAWKNRGVKVFAVDTENKVDDWTKFIADHKLGDWIHARETPEMKAAVEKAGRPSYKQLYDVVTTPTVFLLDKDKKIIAKKLTYQQLNDLLQYRWQQEKK